MTTHTTPIEKELVSVIIPTYNRSGLIVDCIASVLEQTYQNIEVLVVDNLSNDSTISEIKKIPDPRLRIIVEPRRGASIARNTGIMNSTGTILAFLDSDDLWLPQKLSHQLKILSKQDRPSLIFSEYREFNSDRDNILEPRLSSMSLSIITMLTFKKFFLEVGLFNESLKSGEFLEWYARANKLGFNSVTLSEIAALRRLHPGNSLSKRDAMDYLAACRSAIAGKKSS
jgi:glycosyltransferase involved in cell wall biosynthesis